MGTRLTNNEVGMESLSDNLGARVPCLALHEGEGTLEIPNLMRS